MPVVLSALGLRVFAKLAPGTAHLQGSPWARLLLWTGWAESRFISPMKY